MMENKRKKKLDQVDAEDENAPVFKKTKHGGFSVDNFRTAIQGPHAQALSAVKEFALKAKEETVSEYLNAGGSCRDIAALLEKLDQDSIPHAVRIFSSLEVIFMRVQRDEQKYLHSCEQTADYLLQNFTSFFRKMLMFSTKNQKTCLRLLTSIVTLSPQLANQVLRSIRFNKRLLIKLTNSSNREVRTAFIHFVLAFLVGGNDTSINGLLENRFLVKCILPELVYDSSATVQLVLVTLRSKVLENLSVSKTIKCKLFDAKTVQSLIELYNWKGSSKHSGKDSKKNDKVEVDESVQKAVREVVNDILVVLCTSRKYGVVFHDRSLGTTARQHNTILLTVLQGLNKPWENEHVQDLVVKILCASSDLVYQTFLNVAPYLEPRESAKWIEAVSFVQNVIENLQPMQCLFYRDTYNVKQLVTIVTNLCMPACILDSLTTEGFDSQQLVVNKYISILCVMFRKLEQFIDAIEKEKFLTASDFALFSQTVQQHSVNHIPNIDTLLKILEVNASKCDDKAVNVQLLDVIEYYQSLFPDFAEIGIKLESVLISFLLQPQSVGVDDDEFQYKILKALLSFGSILRVMKENLLANFLVLLVKLGSSSTSAVVRIGSRTLFHNVFLQLGIFEEPDEEIDIWLHCLLKSDPGHHTDIINFLVSCIELLLENRRQYASMLFKLSAESDIDHGIVNPYESVFERMMEQEWVSETPHVVHSPFPISVFLPVTLEVLCKSSSPKNIVKYMLGVMIHVIHRQSSLQPIYKLLSPYLDLLPTSFTKYVQGCLPPNQIVPLKKLSDVLILESELSKSIFAGTMCDIDSVESDIHLVVLLRLVTFFMTQAAVRGELSQEMGEKCKYYIDKIFNKGLQLTETEEQVSYKHGHSKQTVCDSLFFRCVKSFFSYSILLQFFRPFAKEKSNTDILVADVIKGAIDKANKHIDKGKLMELLGAYKQEQLSALLRLIKKEMKHKKNKPALSYNDLDIETFHLFHDAELLLKSLVALPVDRFTDAENHDLSVWGELMANLLDMGARAEERCSLPSELIKDVIQLVMKLKEANGMVGSLAGSLQHYIKKYPYHLSVVDEDVFLEMLNLCCGSPNMEVSYFELVRFMLKHNHVLSVVFRTWFLDKENSVNEKLYQFYPLVVEAWNNDVDFQKNVYDIYSSVMKESASQPLQHHLITEDDGLRIFCLLVKEYMDVTTCSEVVSLWEKHGKQVSILQLESMYEILLKVQNETSASEEMAPLVSFVDSILSIVVEKKMHGENSDLNECFKVIENCVEVVKNEKLWSPLQKAVTWKKFMKWSLKLGIGLKCLASLCRRVYKKDRKKATELYEMVTSHSEFFSVMKESSVRKEATLYLMMVLAEISGEVASSSHLPVLLGAYGASMSASDQYLLNLLRQYELQGVQIPCPLWGEAAVSYFAVSDKSAFSLHKQPHMKEVLGLLDYNRMMYTARNFPLNRQLNVPDECSDNTLYDPAYLLPLFSNLLAPGAYAHILSFIDSGSLSFTFAALSSNSKLVRAAGYHVLAQFYHQVEGLYVRSKKLVWLHLIDLVRNGLTLLEDRKKFVQLPCIITVFLANAASILNQPDHKMFTTLHKFMRAKPSLKLYSVPEFFLTFHSSEVDFCVKRHWILTVISSGIRLPRDFNIASSKHVYKIIMAFYSSVLCDDTSKIIILKIILATLNVQELSEKAIGSLGLVSWLQQAIANVHETQVDLLIDILSKMQSYAVRGNTANEPVRVDASHMNQSSQNVHMLLVCMIPKLSMKLPLKYFAEFLAMLEVSCSQYKCQDSGLVLSEAQVTHLLSVAKHVIGDVEDCENMLKLKSCYFVTQDCENLMMSKAKNALKKIIYLSIKEE